MNAEEPDPLDELDLPEPEEEPEESEDEPEEPRAGGKVGTNSPAAQKNEKTAFIRTPITLGKIRDWIRTEALTDRAVAHRLGVSSHMLLRLRRKYPEIACALMGEQPPPVELPPVEHLGPIDDGYTIAKVTEWAHNGLPRESMAALLGISAADFEYAAVTNGAVAEALRRGEAAAEEIASRALMAIVRDPEHKDHFRAVERFMTRRAAAAEAKEPKPGGKLPQKRRPTSAPATKEEPVTHEEILAALRGDK